MILPHLIVTLADGKKIEQSVRIPIFRIGRHKTSDLSIPFSTLSKHHAVIEQKGKTWQLRDLESKNGITFQKEQVSIVELRDNTEVTLGNVNILVQFIQEDDTISVTQSTESLALTEAKKLIEETAVPSYTNQAKPTHTLLNNAVIGASVNSPIEARLLSWEPSFNSYARATVLGVGIATWILGPSYFVHGAYTLGFIFVLPFIINFLTVSPLLLLSRLRGGADSFTGRLSDNLSYARFLSSTLLLLSCASWALFYLGGSIAACTHLFVFFGTALVFYYLAGASYRLQNKIALWCSRGFAAMGAGAILLLLIKGPPLSIPITSPILKYVPNTYFFENRRLPIVPLLRPTPVRMDELQKSLVISILKSRSSHL